MSDSELRAALTHGAATEREAIADVITLLAEFDRRQLYLSDGYRSLFAYCTDALHLSEDAAYSRIQVSRASQKSPRLLQTLRDGSVTLTALAILAPHLSSTNFEALIREARHKRIEDVKLIVARLAPKADVRSMVRKTPARVVARAPVAAAHPTNPTVATVAATDTAPLQTPRASDPAVPKPAVVAPLSPERYKIQITVDADTREVLRQAQDLMRHTVPNGDPAAIISRALRVLVDDLLKKKTAATSRPAQARAIENGSRAIPASVRREVWKRDRGECAFEGARGRCGARGALEYHHVIPYALGGEATAANIELRCRAHNAYQARLDGLAPG